MPEGHTLHALAGRVHHAFAGTAVATSSPQGRFEDGAALLDGRVMLEASAWGKHLFAEFGGDAWLHVHLGLIGKIRSATDAGRAGAAQVPAVRARSACGCSTTPRRRPARADPVRAWITPERGRGGARPARPRPAAAGRRPRGGVAQDPPQPAAGRRAADGPGGAGGNRQRLPLRGAVPAPGRPVPPRQEIRPATWDAIWLDLVDLHAPRGRSGQIITMEDQVERSRAESPRTARCRPMERRSSSTSAQGEPCRVCGSTDPHPRCGGPQPVLVRPLPAPPLTGPRTAHRAGPAPGLPVARWARSATSRPVTSSAC